MRALLLTCLLLLPLPATAETLSAEIGQQGIAATEARLAALPAPAPDEVFALAGLRFLGALESALQQRWRYGLTDTTGLLPFLRAPIAENPAPAPYDPALVANIFRDTATRMDSARTALATLPADADFGLTIAFSDLWFDINANHSRDPGEDLLAVFGPMLLGWEWESRDPATPTPVIRFDAADAAWLSAYTHLVSGFSGLVLAYDPTEPTSRILAAHQALAALGPMTPDYIFGSASTPEAFDSLDLLALVLETLNQTPDAAQMAAAQQHFLAMIADNRRFWALVELEADNEAEWLPNDRQTSALGLELPPGTGAMWQVMLTEMEQVLTGKLLVPYWRYEGGVGVNVGKMFTDPRPIDIAGWIHGWAALPYLEKGQLLSPENDRAFDQLMQGNPMLLTLYLN